MFHCYSLTTFATLYYFHDAICVQTLTGGVAMEGREVCLDCFDKFHMSIDWKGCSHDDQVLDVFWNNEEQCWQPTPTPTQVVPHPYGCPTYDALFKHILCDDKVRNSFLNTFIPNEQILSSQRLDDHMNPVLQFMGARKFLDSCKAVVSGLKDQHVEATVNGRPSIPATKMLTEFVANYGDVVTGFPLEKYGGIMDCVCRLSNGDFALLEVQVIPQDFWDNRALAYASSIYSSQLKKGSQWKDLNC